MSAWLLPEMASPTSADAGAGMFGPRANGTVAAVTDHQRPSGSRTMPACSRKGESVPVAAFEGRVPSVRGSVVNVAFSGDLRRVGSAGRTPRQTPGALPDPAAVYNRIVHRHARAVRRSGEDFEWLRVYPAG
jgi:hypothetical protein